MEQLSSRRRATPAASCAMASASAALGVGAKAAARRAAWAATGLQGGMGTRSAGDASRAGCDRGWLAQAARRLAPPSSASSARGRFLGVQGQKVWPAWAEGLCGVHSRCPTGMAEGEGEQRWGRRSGGGLGAPFRTCRPSHASAPLPPCADLRPARRSRGRPALPAGAGGWAKGGVPRGWAAAAAARRRRRKGPRRPAAWRAPRAPGPRAAPPRTWASRWARRGLRAGLGVPSCRPSSCRRYPPAAEVGPRPRRRGMCLLAESAESAAGAPSRRGLQELITLAGAQGALGEKLGRELQSVPRPGSLVALPSSVHEVSRAR